MYHDVVWFGVSINEQYEETHCSINVTSNNAKCRPKFDIAIQLVNLFIACDTSSFINI